MPRLAVLLALALAALPVSGDAPAPIRFDIARTYDLTNLSPLGAGSLRHQRATFRVALDSSEDLHNGYTIYGCESVDGKLRTVWLVPGVEVDDEMTVEATLRVIVHAPTVGANGTRFEGFTEYRLMDAVRVK